MRFHCLTNSNRDSSNDQLNLLTLEVLTYKQYLDWYAHVRVLLCSSLALMVHKLFAALSHVDPAVL